jgi:hypothetical protein
MLKLAKCITLDLTHILVVSRGRLSTGKLLELALLYLTSKSFILVILLVPGSIQLFISKFLLNEAIPHP